MGNDSTDSSSSNAIAVDLHKISGKEFLEKYLTLENVDIAIGRVVKEVAQEERAQPFQKMACKLGLPLDDIESRAFKIMLAIRQFASPLEIFEAGGVIGIDDFLNKEYPPRPYFMKPWLQPGSLVMIYGAAGIGKTYLRDTIALAITRGGNIGPWEVETPAGVLILDGEMPCQSLQRRLRELSHGLPEAMTTEPLDIISASDLLSEGYDAPNLNNTTWKDSLIQLFEKRPQLKVLILDNVVSLFPGLDENLSKDWSPANEWMLKLRAMGLAVIKIHHPTKKGNSARGTGLHDLNMDTVIKLTRPKAYNQKQGARFEVHFEKGRELFGNQAEPFLFQLIRDPSNPNGLTWKTEKISRQESDNGKENENLKTIITSLADGMKQKDIAEKIDCSSQYVSRVKRKAINDGILDKNCHLTKKGQQQYGEGQQDDRNEEQDGEQEEDHEGG